MVALPMNTTFNPQFLEKWNWCQTTLCKIRVDQYQEMIAKGILTSEDKVELLEGLLVAKMPQNPPHAILLCLLYQELLNLLTNEWVVRSQLPITLSESAPEPDFVIVKGPITRYWEQHPTKVDIALIIEIADTTLDRDQWIKLPIYADAKIPCYWILNVQERQIEIYTQPKRGRNPTYKNHIVVPYNSNVPLTFHGNLFGEISLSKLFPVTE